LAFSEIVAQNCYRHATLRFAFRERQWHHQLSNNQFLCEKIGNDGGNFWRCGVANSNHQRGYVAKDKYY
jgi:hypothetical protein